MPARQEAISEAPLDWSHKDRRLTLAPPDSNSSTRRCGLLREKAWYCDGDLTQGSLRVRRTMNRSERVAGDGPGGALGGGP